MTYRRDESLRFVAFFLYLQYFVRWVFHRRQSEKIPRAKCGNHIKYVYPLWFNLNKSSRLSLGHWKKLKKKNYSVKTNKIGKRINIFPLFLSIYLSMNSFQLVDLYALYTVFFSFCSSFAESLNWTRSLFDFYKSARSRARNLLFADNKLFSNESQWHQGSNDNVRQRDGRWTKKKLIYV